MCKLAEFEIVFPEVQRKKKKKQQNWIQNQKRNRIVHVPFQV